MFGTKVQKKSLFAMLYGQLFLFLPRKILFTMTNKHFLLLLTMSFSVLGNAQNTTANPDNMTLVWSDEFDYTGAPDSTRWQYEYGFVRNEELQ